MHVCGGTLNEVVAPSSDFKDDPDKIKTHQRQRHTMKVIIVIVLLMINVPLALYFSLIHQRGTIDVMAYVHKETTGKLQQNENNSPVVLYLMPCHSTPYYR